nr:MAG TPA: hypothetical protein [Caudoviricetes sp.]
MISTADGVLPLVNSLYRSSVNPQAATNAG